MTPKGMSDLFVFFCLADLRLQLVHLALVLEVFLLHLGQPSDHLLLVSDLF